MSANELIQRRGAMMQSRSGGIDWETIARGMIDCVTDFDLPESVDASKSYIFYGRTGLISATISTTSASVGIGAFQNCSKLKAITIPSNVTRINLYAFSGCRELESVTIENGVTRLDSYVFQTNPLLTSLTLPSSVDTLGAQFCTAGAGLVEVVIEATTPPTAGALMFAGCTNLSAIYVPDASVSAYQAASGWSTYASIIKPISQRPT